VHFEAVLNAVWLGVGAIALANTIRVTCGRNADAKRAPAWLHVVGVALIVVALFPFISATDDVLRIEHFNAQHDRSHPNKQSQNDELMRLYQVMDSPLACRVSEIALIFFFFSVVFTLIVRLIDRIAPFEAGRSPPLPAHL